MKSAKLSKNKLSLSSKFRMASSNFMERKWRNCLIAAATSIGFIGILISFGLGNAIVNLINKETNNGNLPAQLQVSINPDVASSGVINQDDVDTITDLVGSEQIKYLETPFSTTLTQISLLSEGELDLSQSLPNYAQVVSLYQDTSIATPANTKKDVLAGPLYTDKAEEGITLPATFVDDFNKANQTNLSYADMIGRQIHLTISESTATETKTSDVSTVITRIVKDELLDSNSYMASSQLERLLQENGFTKHIPYIILELKNPDKTSQVSDTISDNKKYLVISQRKILNTIIQFIKIIQGLLILLSSQAIIVSMVMIGVIIYINIMQRSREIGVMKAVGYLNKDVRTIFLYESLLITFISLIFAFIVSTSIGAIANQVVKHYVPSIETVFSLNVTSILVMIGLALIMGLVSAYFPTLKISKLDPVESLRYE